MTNPNPPRPKLGTGGRRHGHRPKTKSVHYTGLATLTPAEHRIALAIKRGCEMCNIRIEVPVGGQ
jgi:hypothetical protein